MQGWGETDAEGRLVLPSEVAQAYGLETGARFFVEESPDGLVLRRPTGNLAKVYIEVTNACNLECRTCIRNNWGESLGWMSVQTFNRIAANLRNVFPMPSVFFGGFGEPLSHPNIVAMVAAVKAAGAKAELITNGTLLTREMSRLLIEAGLDGLWVSLDGARPESYADIRLGAELPKIVANVAAFRDACFHKSYFFRYPDNLTIGVVFVAMKRNIADLPNVVHLGEQLGATRFLVTNVLPYTSEMSDQTLYLSTLIHAGFRSSYYQITLPSFDRGRSTGEAIHKIDDIYRIARPGSYPGESSNRCSFVLRGATVIRWDGNVSPCLPLMYDHRSFVSGVERFSKKYPVGNISESALSDLWNAPDYVAFRERVQAFDFPPCTQHCCELSEGNEEDCFDNPFPTCGGCLWAQGIIQCP